MDKAIKKPAITVLMPVYNGEKFLLEAIQSILKQTFEDFEFLIINDGSTDASKKIIESQTDNRIKLINNYENLGLIKSLNLGINLAKGKYIARMDCDDISLPFRLKAQYDFMEKYPKIGISGGWAKVFGEGKKFINKYYTSNEDIKANFIFFTSMCHPTVIMRKNIIKKNNLYYNPIYKHSEDREFWIRASNFCKLANINKVVLLYRQHNKSICKTFRSEQNLNKRKIIKKLLANININASQKNISLHLTLKSPDGMAKNEFIKMMDEWFIFLLEKNKKVNYFDNNSLKKIFKKRLILICRANSGYNYQAFKTCIASKILKNKNKEDLLLLVKFFIKNTFNIIKSKSLKN